MLPDFKLICVSNTSALSDFGVTTGSMAFAFFWLVQRLPFISLMPPHFCFTRFSELLCLLFVYK